MLNGQGYLTNYDVINGVLQPVSPAYAINPAAFGPSPIMYDTYAAQPTVPPYAGTSPGGGTAGTGGQTDTANNAAASAAAANPFSFKLSPLLWSVIFLLVGLVGLRVVHWGT